ncbi:MAG: protein N-lysine methyltransferase family protein [Gemmataceae bacterium]|nr:protein N-lysine methyltransferase family protein [Gemmataceae bacterium]
MWSDTPAPPPELILPRLGPIVRETVYVEGQAFVIQRPSETDKLLDLPPVESAFRLDEYLPYWADLWPAARMLAKVVAKEPWPLGLEALELGCGLGLVGIVALARGLRVTFSDYDLCALKFAADNARLNGFTEFETMPLDWRHPPANVQYPVILGSDLIYERRNVEPLVRLIRQALAPGGLCLLTDHDRIPAKCIRDALSDCGLTFEAKFVRAGEPGGRRWKGTLYRITAGKQGCSLESDDLLHPS